MDSQEPVKRISFLALDRHALGASSSEELTAAIASDEVAAAHVEAVTPRDAPAVPAWVRELGPRRRRWARPALLSAAAAVAVAAVLIVALGRGGGERETDYTTIKGSADVAVFVKRDDRVFRWDRREPLHAGDAIRLQIAPDGYRRVAVFAEERGALVELHSAVLAGDRPALLDAAWMLDTSKAGDVIVVVLSHGPIDAGQARAALDNPGRSPHWAQRIRLRAAKELP